MFPRQMGELYRLELEMYRAGEREGIPIILAIAVMNLG